MYWPNLCYHANDSYIASFEWMHSAKEIKQYDIYVFKDSRDEQFVCLRYGSNLEDYLSPGNLVESIEQSGMNTMKRRAIELILMEGKIEFRRFASGETK